VPLGCAADAGTDLAMNRRVIGAAQAVVTVVLLALLFRGFDWGAFRALYSRLPFWFYAASLVVMISGQVMYAWRWRTLLTAGGTDLRFGVVLRQYLIGTFISNFLPSTVGGDAAKVYYLGSRHGYRAITTSVVVDRVIGLGLTASLATVALWAVSLPDSRYQVVRIVLTAITGGFAAVIGLTFVGTGGLPRRVGMLGPRVVALAVHLQQFRTKLASSVRAPRVWVNAVAVVTAYFALVTLVYEWFIVLDAGSGPGFVPVLMAVTSMSVLTNLPVTVNGLGLREQLHVLLFEPLGVPKEAAVAISLLLFGHVVAISAVGGILWWRTSRDLGRVSSPL
jgi:uncharacterized protein (TIRG00374 family)